MKRPYYQKYLRKLNKMNLMAEFEWYLLEKIYEDEICYLAKKRFIEGYKKFGIKSFSKSDEEIEKEILEELADFINWKIIKEIK